MQQVTERELLEYANRMQEIVRRTIAIDRIRQASNLGFPWIVVVEVSYLQLRHILELVATALLVVNREAVLQSGNEKSSPWHAIEILKVIEEVNADFFPKPLKKQEKDEEGIFPLKEIKGDVLTKENFVTLYKQCGEVLHTRNPFAKKRGIKRESRRNCEKLLRQADRWQFRIVGLLTHHEFRLRDDDTLYFAHSVGENYEFQVAEFAPISEDEALRGIRR